MTTGRDTGETSSAGRRVTVRVPATSANLGPGFDSFGLAVGIHDRIVVSTAPSGVEVTVSGQGEGTLPTDGTHLVARALRAGLDHAGSGQVGLRLACRNEIPQGRGLGSSAAAVVGGLLAARGLVKLAGSDGSRRLVGLGLAALLAWNVGWVIYPRLVDGRGHYGMSRRDADTVAAADLANALVFVQGDHWTDYANLLWLNAPDLDGEVVFAKDRGPVENGWVMGQYPGRAVYHYDRDRVPALKPYER
jgi:hypothetical protein